MRHFVTTLAILLVAACGSEAEGPPLSATGVSVLEPMSGMSMTAGYFALENRGAETIRITSVTSPQFARIEMHETVVENDVARMRPIEYVTVEAGETLVFEPGGMHLMMFEPSRPLENVTLDFFEDDTLLLSVDTPVTGR